MSRRASARLAILAELSFDAVLLLIFIAQAFLLGCLVTFGHVPIPADWANKQLKNRLPEDLSIRATDYFITLDGQFNAANITVNIEGFEATLFKADGAIFNFDPQSIRRLRPQLEDVVLSNGSLTLPAVYSPSGMDTEILERIALRLIPKKSALSLDSFAALHEGIRLRGNSHLYLSEPTETGQSREMQDTIRNFFRQASSILKQKSTIEGLEQPTIFFQVKQSPEESIKINSIVSSRQLKLPMGVATNISLEADLKFATDRLYSQSSALFKAESIDLPEFKTSVRSATALIKQDEWQELLAGELPDLEIAAEAIAIERIHLDAPRIKIRSEALPIVSFDGATSGFEGAIEFDGVLNLRTREAKVNAAGNIHLLPVASSTISSKLPNMDFGSPPYYNLSLHFEDGFFLKSAELDAEIEDISVDGIVFDHIRASASYKDGIYSIPEIYLRRDWQWLDVGFQLDSSSYDYKLSLYGFAKPYEYNDILPRWWGSIFKEFSFENVDDGLGDFIIYGNTKQRAADLFFGHVRARNVSYKGVWIDEGHLFVRGRGPYAEIHALEAKSGRGWVKGDIRFASRIDNIRGPMSVRLDLDTALPLSEAQKLFDGEIADVIGDFKSEALPRTRLVGAIFNDKYPDLADKSFIDLKATSTSPLEYRKIPLDYLSLNLYWRNDLTYLRELKIGYAGGDGIADADVITGDDVPATTRFHFDLQGADQDLAMANIGLLDNEENKVPKEEIRTGQGTLDLVLHARGPVEDPFKFEGFGSLHIYNQELSAIQLFGPLSRQLQNTRFGFTSFSLNALDADFRLDHDTTHITKLEVNGPRTKVESSGTMKLRDQALDMRVSVFLFGNAGNPDSHLRKLGDIITKPIPNLLEFELKGTADQQKWRSLYDPRKLIPQF